MRTPCLWRCGPALWPAELPAVTGPLIPGVRFDPTGGTDEAHPAAGAASLLALDVSCLELGWGLEAALRFHASAGQRGGWDSTRLTVEWLLRANVEVDRVTSDAEKKKR